MDGVRLTDEQIAALAQDGHVALTLPFYTCHILGGTFEWEGLLASAVVQGLAAEVQESRALRSVMAAAVRAVNAGSFTPFDALAQIVAELASLDSRAVADGH
jgi:hypothetical protein